MSVERLHRLQHEFPARVSRHGTEAFAAEVFLGHGRAVQLVQSWLVVKEVELGRSTGLKQKDHALRPGRVVSAPVRLAALLRHERRSGYVGEGPGGAAFGMMGDRLGRKTALQLTLLLFGLGSVGSAFAWDYSSLAILRFITGIGLGGEWGAGMVLFNEAWNPRRRGLGSAFIAP